MSLLIIPVFIALIKFCTTKGFSMVRCCTIKTKMLLTCNISVDGMKLRGHRVEGQTSSLQSEVDCQYILRSHKYLWLLGVQSCGKSACKAIHKINQETD